MLNFEIPVEPQSWLAPRKGKSEFYDLRRNHKLFVCWFLKSQYKDQPITDYVHLSFIFHFSFPKSISKKLKKNIANEKLFPRNCDLTNCQKLYEDCLKKIVISDDRYVVKITSEKLYAYKGKVIISVIKI